jgi:hypothetical protein
MDSILISFHIFISGLGVVLRWGGIGLGLPQVKTNVVPASHDRSHSIPDHYIFVKYYMHFNQHDHMGMQYMI